MSTKKLFVIFFTILCSNLSALADSMPVPVKLQISIFLKIISYDRAVKSDIKIGVLTGGSQGEVIKGFEALSGQKINGFSFSSVPVSVSDLGNLKGKGINVLYVTPDNSAHISNIKKSANSAGVLTITGVPEYVESGLSVGIGIKGNKPEIVVNIPSFKDEKRDLSSQLLKLAKVIK